MVAVKDNTFTATGVDTAVDRHLALRSQAATLHYSLHEASVGQMTKYLSRMTLHTLRPRQSLLTRPDIVLRGEERLDDGLLLGGGGGAAAAVELPVQQRDDPLHGYGDNDDDDDDDDDDCVHTWPSGSDRVRFMSRRKDSRTWLMLQTVTEGK